MTTGSKFEVYTGTAPSAWASYLVNGDASSLDDEERCAADRFRFWLGGDIVSCEDAGFIRDHDAFPFYAYGADCQTYTAIF
jgi:hypothetical protein